MRVKLYPNIRIALQLREENRSERSAKTEPARKLPRPLSSLSQTKTFKKNLHVMSLISLDYEALCKRDERLYVTTASRTLLVF